MAVILCDALGVLCIILNAFVIASLLMNRRRVLSNVFYVLVLHCAVVDMIRGGCLVAWGMPHLLLVESLNTMRARLFALKVGFCTLDQWVPSWLSREFVERANKGLWKVFEIEDRKKLYEFPGKNGNLM